MLPLFFAPIQGYTDHLFRRLHHEIIGGVETYYTPFIRWEHGAVRNKDLRDVNPLNCQNIPTIPQVIAKNHDEFCRLCDLLQSLGWREINLNLGCPFPMQTGAGRGSGLLSHADIIEEIFNEMQQRSEISFSVKMRLGLNNPEESYALLPMLNVAPLHHITLHARLGVQQYKGTVSQEAFSHFYDVCRKPLIYNGDITTVEQIHHLEKQYPNLKGVMIGRGLLARPTLALEYQTKELSLAERLEKSLAIHKPLRAYAEQHLEGEIQQLARLRCFWEYQEALLPRKSYKTIMKSKSLRNYTEAVNSLQMASRNSTFEEEI